MSKLAHSDDWGMAEIARMKEERDLRGEPDEPTELYRDFIISYDPPPIPVRTCDWHATHKDYDGAPDANDQRCFHAGSLEEIKAEIDAWHDEQSEPVKNTSFGAYQDSEEFKAGFAE